MNKARKKFILYAECAVFILLTVLLTVINMVNFTMVSEDADRITEKLSFNHGTFNNERPPQQDNNFTKKRFTDLNEMGPNSPELNFSLRYFTYAFDKEGNAEQVIFKMAAVTEEEAQEWAQSLVDQSIGWTRGTYRYRVYQEDKKTYVTVIDQSRELLPSYRILIISVCGEIAVLILSWLILLAVGKKIFKPLEESDRKQKQFIKNIENDFKLPLTIINANTEIMEKQNGPSECTNIINKQVRKMTSLVKDLGVLSIFNEKDLSLSHINLSDILNHAIDKNKEKFAEKKIELKTDIASDIIIKGDENSMKKAISELLENSLKYSQKEAVFQLEKLNDRIMIKQSNDTTLPSGNIDKIFDRFTTLSNAQENSTGLGLSYVKDTVKAHNGRIRAKVSDNTFLLEIDL